ncbi:hypothetical protein PI27_gp090 [Listeria phage WIL-1]|nr:hypothetical protein PI27_gp090 [Listeria phage WIL-1]
MNFLNSSLGIFSLQNAKLVGTPQSYF